MRSLLALAVVCLAIPLFAQFPVPIVYQPLQPTSAVPGSPAFTLTVHGTCFTSDSVVTCNLSPRPSAFVSSSELRASISASDVFATQGSAGGGSTQPG